MTNKFRYVAWPMTHLTNILLLGLVFILSVHQYKVMLSNYFEAKADRFYWDGEYTQSLQYYKRALEHDDGSLFLVLKYGDLLGAEGNRVAAIKHLRSISLYCFSPDIELRLGQLLSKEGNFDSAIFHYENVHYLSPSKLTPLYHLAKVNYAAENVIIADSISNVVIHMVPKVNSPEAILMKEELKYFKRAKSVNLE